MNGVNELSFGMILETRRHTVSASSSNRLTVFSPSMISCSVGTRNVLPFRLYVPRSPRIRPPTAPAVMRELNEEMLRLVPNEYAAPIGFLSDATTLFNCARIGRSIVFGFCGTPFLSGNS